MAEAGAKHRLFDNDSDDDDFRMDVKRQKREGTPVCHRMQRCRDFLEFLNLDPAYFDPQYDRCYCQNCAARIPDLLETDRSHNQPYEVPKGWCGFGLSVPARARAEKVFEKWVVSFHGCPSSLTPSILRQGELLMPGDTLLDGTKLPNRLTRGNEDRIGLYTSPSIRYSELDVYTEPADWNGHKVRIVIQCRQVPSSFRAAGETVSWERCFGNAAISQYFTNDEIERFTHARGSIIPYRVLVGMDIQTRKQEEEHRRQLERRLQQLKQEVRHAEELARAAERRRARAEDARARAEEARARAEDARARAEEARALAEETRARAEEAHTRAEEAAEYAMSASRAAERVLHEAQQSLPGAPLLQEMEERMDRWCRRAKYLEEQHEEEDEAEDEDEDQVEDEEENEEQDQEEEEDEDEEPDGGDEEEDEGDGCEGEEEDSYHQNREGGDCHQRPY